MFTFKRKKKLAVVPQPVDLAVTPAQVITALSEFELPASTLAELTGVITRQSQLKWLHYDIRRQAVSVLERDLTSAASIWSSASRTDLRLLLAAQFIMGPDNLHPVFASFKERIAKPYMSFADALSQRNYDVSPANRPDVLPSIDGFIAFAEPVDLTTGRRPSQPEFFDPLSRDNEIDFWHAFVKKCMFISLTSNRAPGGAVYINGSSGNWTLLEARIAAELEKKE